MIFPAATSYTAWASDGNAPYGTTTIQASGNASKIDLSHLTTLQGGGYYSDSGWQTNISPVSGGEIDLAGAISGFTNGQYRYNVGVTITMNGSGGVLNVQNVTSLDRTSITVGAGDILRFNSVTALSDVNLTANGGQLIFPAATSYTGSNMENTTIATAGSGSLIRLTDLSTFAGGGSYSDYDYSTSVLPTSGGEIDLAGAISTNGGNANYNHLTLDNTGGILGVAGITSLANTYVTDTGGESLTFTEALSLTAVNLSASGGSQLLFPAATSYTGSNVEDTTIAAAGSGSLIRLTDLSTFAGGGSYSGYHYSTSVLPTSGGEIDLAGAISINSNANRNDFTLDNTGGILGLAGITSLSYTTLTAANGGTFTLPAGWAPVWGTGDTLTTTGTGSSFVSQSDLTISGNSLAINAGTFINEGVLNPISGGTLNFNGNLYIDDPGIITGDATGTINVTGNLLGTTKNASLFAPQAQVCFDGSGTSSAPQLLEAFSQDLLNTSAGFVNNFAYATIVLANNTYVDLVDQSHNTASSNPEATYVNSLVVSAGSTLNLNSLTRLNLYDRAEQIAGLTVGVPTQTPNAGPITLDAPTPGTLSLVGGEDAWTFFARGGRSITVVVNPGAGAAPAPLSPTLNWAQVQLVNSADTVLQSASSEVSGGVVTLTGVVLPADGTYKVLVSATPGHTVTGNYIVTAYDSTPNVMSLNLNQQVAGTIHTPYSQDQWTFSAAAGQQVQFLLAQASAQGLTYSLTGPAGFTGGFTDISASLGLVTLNIAGNYILTAHGLAGQTGNYAFTLQQTVVNNLTLGTPYTGALAGSGQAQLFTVTVTTAQPLSIVLTDPSAGDHTELYASFGPLPPTRETYDYGDSSSGASHSLLVPNATPGTWYVLVYGESVLTPDSFTLQTTSSPLILTGVTPDQYGANANAVLTVTGAGFDTTSSVSLVSSDGTIYSPASTTFNTFTQLTANFNLTNVPQGIYSVKVSHADGTSGQLPNAFTVNLPGQANLQTKLILPSTMGYHISSTIYVQYSNTGTAAMPAPVLLLESSYSYEIPFMTLAADLQVAGYWTSAQPEGYSPVAEILASGKTPGVLEPGESVTVPVYYAGMKEPWTFISNFKFDLKVFTTTDSDAADWTSVKSSLQPAGVPNAAWNTIYGNLTSQMGGTWGGYVQLLDNEAAYLGQLGENITDVGTLWGFAVQQADNALNPIGPYLASATDEALATPGNLSLSFSRTFASTIYGRDIMGPLGLGWSDNWQTSVTKGSDGTITINTPGGGQRIFQPDSQPGYTGCYFSQPGDTGTLTAVGGGGYLLTESDGIETDYSSNGLLNYMQDTDGNRITAGYTSGLLTSLTSSSGASLTIAYNSANLISTVTDSLGRIATYTYDASNQYLLSVTDVTGQTTSYTYNTTSGAAAQNALTAITYPGNTHQYFTYDGQGRLASTYQDNGAATYTFAYNQGQVSVTNILGDTTTLYYNEDGLVAKSVDPLGNVTLGSYDNNYNLTSITNALGQSESYAYNAAGEVSSWTDFLGNTTLFNYSGPFNELSSMIDAKGNTTQYSYNSTGNLLSVTYANGSSESVTYNPLGEATSFVDANAQPINYTYNDAGQIKTATFSDGTVYTYTYDSYGDLLTAADPTGTTKFTYDPSTQQLTEVAYPNGTFLKFTYNAAGQRTQMVDQTSFTTNYTYNADGWLSQITDASGNPIATYYYCNCGHLKKQVNGNGTYTTYDYDADGDLIDLVNYAPNGTTNSSFVYTYNSLGLETGETTLDGAWSYTYDADGQLTHAVFASNNPASIQNQDLAYSYDALGNRTVTVINGVHTTYVTNNMNQYTSVGGVACTYDANGNLLSDGTNTYTYNSLNELTGVTGPSETTSYTYNSLGQLVSSTTNGQTTQYLIDPAGLGNVVGTYNGSGGLIADYTYGFGLTSQVTPGGTYYYDFDSLGSTVGISNSSGTYVNTYSYSPFGANLSSTITVSNPFQFVGKAGLITEDNGLDFMRARFYSFSLGRFTSPDPLGLGGGDANLFRYAGNSPTQVSDPSGLQSLLPSLPFVPFVPFVPGGGGGGGGGGGPTFHFTPPDDHHDEHPENHTDPENHCDKGSLWGIIDPTGLPPCDRQMPEPPKPRLPGEPGGPPPPTPTPTPTGPGNGGPSSSSATSNAWDPNAMIGPSGYGAADFVQDAGVYPYTVDFENAATATAPAQQVTITDQLDPNLDWSTFQLTGIGWGNFNLVIPPDSQHFQATVPMTYDGQTFDVDVEAGIHTATGQVYATFYSINPATGLPPDVLIGFLPPEDGTGRGEGYISYLVEPKANLATGTQIRNVADIVFDGQPAIATDQISDTDPSQGTDPNKEALVTIDAAGPTSSMGPLPAYSSTSFAVTWSGQDDTNGSGIASYNVYVSDDGGLANPWPLATATTATSAVFTGVDGHTYAFSVEATDNVGNEQSQVSAAVTTDVQPPNAPSNLTPADGATRVSLTPAMKASAFIDIDPGGDTQTAAEWVITRTSDNTVVLDTEADTTDLTNYSVPSGILAYNTGYTWQVRYEDSGGLWSDYSTATSFTTLYGSPVVTTSAGSLSYLQGAAPGAVDPGITVSDAGSTTLVGATVTISGNYASGQDMLGFANQNGIAGNWNAATDVLTLSGSSSVANYQAALQSVTYIDTSANPSALTRTVSFVADNGASTDNLSVSATRTVTVTRRSYMDLTGTFGATWTLPLSIVASKSLTGYASVVVKNIGNESLPAGQLVNIQVVAHDMTNPANPDITLVTLSKQSVSKLAANGSATFLPYVNRTAGLPADVYQILANIIPVQALAESRTDNNQVLQTAAGATETITSAPPFVDLMGQFGSTMKFPATLQSGGGKLVTVPVVVKNVGNVALAAGQKIDIEIEASSNGVTTPLKILTGESVSALGAGKSATFTTTVTMPPGMATWTCNLVATVDSSDEVTGDTNRANNTVTSTSAIAITEGHVDLAGVFGTTWTLPPSVVDNVKLTGTASVVVKNLGDVALPTGQTVNIQLVAQDTTVPSNAPIILDTLINQSVSVLAASGSKQFTLPVSLPAGLPSDDYQILANITPVQALTESKPDNNQVLQTASGQTETIISAAPFVDLSGAFGTTMKLPATYTSGSGKLITVPVVVKNVGNVALAAGQKINIEIDAFDGTTTTPLKTLTGVSVSTLGAGKSATFTTTVVLPVSLKTGTYNIVAVVDTLDQVTGDTNRANNTVTSIGSIAVTRIYVDLSGSTFWTSTLPTSVAADTPLNGDVWLTLKNIGTMAMPAGQMVEFQLMAYDTTTPTNSPIALVPAAGELSGMALAVGATSQINLPVNLTGGLPSDSYQIEATITMDNNQTDFNASVYTVLLNALGNTLSITVN